jgi:hypothetical protein
MLFDISVLIAAVEQIDFWHLDVLVMYAAKFVRIAGLFNNISGY